MEQKFPRVFWSKQQFINEELFINRMKEWEQGCKCTGRIPTPASPSGKLLPQHEPEKAFGNPWGSCPCLWGWWKDSATLHRGGLGSQEALSGLGRLLKAWFPAPHGPAQTEASAAAQSKCRQVGDNLTGMKAWSRIFLKRWTVQGL